MSENAGRKTEKSALRILLINAPLAHGSQVPIPGIIRDKGKDMPLGLMYLAGSLKKAGFSRVRLVDAYSEGLGPLKAAGQVAEWKPDLLGITVYSFSFYDVSLFVDHVRRRVPSCHISLGGPHVSVYPELVLQTGLCDSVCAGYGENAIVDLATYLHEENKRPVIPGMGFHGAGAQAPILPDTRITGIDALPWPDRDLVDPEHYTSWIVDRPVSTTAMMTSRGCPYRCCFCAQAKAPFAQRSVGNVLEEVRDCIERGFQMINFEDDCMNLRVSWMQEFAESMTSLDKRPAWGFRGRAADFDEKLARLCKEAGCIRINFGVESGSDKTLESIGKGIETGQAALAVKAAKKAGISTVCYFIMGFPGETEEQMNQTFLFSRKLDPDYAQFTPLVLLPGTQLYEREKSLNGPSFDPWGEYTLHPSPDFLPPVVTGAVDRRRVFRRVRISYLKFYFSPQFLFSGKGIRGGLRRGFRGGLSLIAYIVFGPREKVSGSC